MCVKQNLSQIFSLLLPPSLLSSLLCGLNRKSFDVALCQCCDRRPKRNQMLFGLACGGEAYI